MKPSTDPCSEFVPHVCQKGKCNQCFCKEEDHAQGSNINSDNVITLRSSSPAVPSRSSIPVRPNPIHQPRTSTMANGKTTNDGNSADTAHRSTSKHTETSQRPRNNQEMSEIVSPDADDAYLSCEETKFIDSPVSEKPDHHQELSDNQLKHSTNSPLSRTKSFYKSISKKVTQATERINTDPVVTAKTIERVEFRILVFVSPRAGKSQLINALCGEKELAKTSASLNSCTKEIQKYVLRRSYMK